MRALVVVVVASLPAIALAQPGVDPSAPPMAPDLTPGFSAPPLTHAPLPPVTFRHGLTLEANIGFGYLHVARDDPSGGGLDVSNAGLAGLELGAGGWLTPRLALTLRVAGVALETNSVAETAVFVGPSVQCWISDQLWVGVGAGLAGIVATGDGETTTVDGLGLDLRVGYTIASSSAHTLNVSVEVTPSYYSDIDGYGTSGTSIGMGFLLGYQYL